MIRSEKKAILVVVGAALWLALGVATLSGAGAGGVAHFSQAAPRAVVAAELAPSDAATHASSPPERVLSLDEARARWYEQVYGGRTFAGSEGLARHPEP